MITDLTSVSPFAFEMVRRGDCLVIVKKTPSKYEFRSKIGAKKESLVLHKGITKIGIVPPKIYDENPVLGTHKHCWVKEVDLVKKLIIVEFKTN
jgi:hypothetical protein